MKKLLYIILIVFIMMALLYVDESFASPLKMINIGNLHVKVMASGHQSETCGVLPGVGYHVNDDTYWEVVRTDGTRFGVVNWKDENGNELAGRGIRLAGAPYGSSDEVANMFAVPDEDGLLIRRYFRYQPPEVVVDELHLEPPFPRTGDEVNPDKIKNFGGNSNCTADVLITSHARTWMGLDVYWRTLAWGQRNHDDYIVWDVLLVNTGNIDMDDDIELPDQTLDSLFIMRQLEHFPTDPSWAYSEWHDWWGVTPEQYDSMPLRMVYFYNIPETWAPGEYVMGFNFDDWWGQPNFVSDPVQVGEATIFMPKTKPGSIDPVDELFPNNPAADDSTQPRSHGAHGPDDFPFKHHSGMRPTEDWELVYDVMKFGEVVNPKYAPYVTTMTGTFPGTYHDVPPIDRDGDHPNNQPGAWYFWHGVAHTGSGPYNLEFGDSLRFVFVIAANALTKESCNEIGQGWADGSLRYYGPSHLPHKWFDYDLWMGVPDYTSDSANLAKDELIYSVIDSINNNALAAQWNFDQGYSAPDAPPPPSFYVYGKPNKVELSWGDESEDASDFAGYKIYRALGAPGPTYQDGEFLGSWEHIYQCGGADPGGGVEYSASVTHQFDDETALRGQEYYYYITAFDGGGENDYYGPTEPLESSKWITRTTQPVSLTRLPQDDLAKIRVVPNPFNANAEEVQFYGAPDRIVFMDLPGFCTIKIYNETGDLIKVLEHNDGSGDEPWADETFQHYMTTESGQVVVPGIYIAHISTPDGESTDVKFLIIR